MDASKEACQDRRERVKALGVDVVPAVKPMRKVESGYPSSGAVPPARDEEGNFRVISSVTCGVHAGSSTAICPSPAIPAQYSAANSAVLGSDSMYLSEVEGTSSSAAPRSSDQLNPRPPTAMAVAAGRRPAHLWTLFRNGKCSRPVDWLGFSPGKWPIGTRHSSWCLQEAAVAVLPVRLGCTLQ
jgi:hypothetical protein